MRTFTFGFDHKHPITGASLANHYIQVPGDADQSRDIMLAVFGRNWAMQYESPSKLKYLDRMTELKWTDELGDRASGYLIELMGSVQTPTEVDDELLTAAVAAQAELDASARDTQIDAYFDDLKARDPKALDALQAEAHAGEAIVEYALRFKSGAHQSLPDSTDVANFYPIGKQIRHHMKFGEQVYRRRLVVVEDWTLVSAEEVEILCEPYDKHVVDLTPKDIKLP